VQCRAPQLCNAEHPSNGHGEIPRRRLSPNYRQSRTHHLSQKHHLLSRLVHEASQWRRKEKTMRALGVCCCQYLRRPRRQFPPMHSLSGLQTSPLPSSRGVAAASSFDYLQGQNTQATSNRTPTFAVIIDGSPIQRCPEGQLCLEGRPLQFRQNSHPLARFCYHSTPEEMVVTSPSQIPKRSLPSVDFFVSFRVSSDSRIVLARQGSSSGFRFRLPSFLSSKPMLEDKMIGIYDFPTLPVFVKRLWLDGVDACCRKIKLIMKTNL
jgi:hypothetical protein